MIRHINIMRNRFLQVLLWGIISSCWIVYPGFVSANDASVSVSVSKNNLTLRERFQLSFEFVNFSDTPEPDISQIPDVTLISGPSKSNQFSWINGRSTKTYMLTYTMAPLKTGQITIPSFTFRDKRTNYSTEPVTITVHDPQAAPDQRSPGSELKPFYLELLVSNKNPYNGEPIIVTYKIYFRQNIRNFHVDRNALFTGFLTEYLPIPRSPKVLSDVIDGIAYQTAIIQELILTPTRSGDYVIPSQVVRLEVESPTSGRRSIFDDPFGMGIQLRNVDVISPEVPINVLPLPDKRPASFTGAVGEFTMTAGFDSSTTEENQAVTLKIEVKGTGNLKNFTFPKPEFPEQFMVFEPEHKENVSLGPNGFSGSKSWEYVIIPNYQGSYYFDPIEFAYFSPKEKKFKVLQISDLILNVRPNTRLIREQQRGLSRQEVELLSQDIRFIQLKERNILNENRNRTVHNRDAIGYILTFFACLAWFIILIVRYFLARNPAYMKKVMAFRNMQARIDKLSGDPKTDMADLPKIFSRYISDKMGVDRQTINKSDVLNYCQRHKINEETRNKIKEWWNQVEALNYLPSQIDENHVEHLKNDMITLLRVLEKKG